MLESISTLVELLREMNNKTLSKINKKKNNKRISKGFSTTSVQTDLRSSSKKRLMKVSEISLNKSELEK